MQQTAVAAAGEIAPPGANTSEAISRPQLHNLSIEHAAIAVRLSDRELRLVQAVGAGMKDKEIALHMGITPATAATYVRDLRLKTRMSRISLAIFGYQLRGQVPQN